MHFSLLLYPLSYFRMSNISTHRNLKILTRFQNSFGGLGNCGIEPQANEYSHLQVKLLYVFATHHTLKLPSRRSHIDESWQTLAYTNLPYEVPKGFLYAAAQAVFLLLGSLEHTTRSWYRRRDLNPHDYKSEDFKSPTSTNSITPTY